MEIRKIKIFVFFILFFCFLGLLDVFYLSLNYFNRNLLICLSQSGCGLVTSSSYSQILGIPLVFLGLFYYFFLLILAFLFILKNKKTFLNYILYISFLGFLFYLRLIYLQFFVINAFCLYCFLSAIFNFMILFFFFVCKRNFKESYL